MRRSGRPIRTVCRFFRTLASWGRGNCSGNKKVGLRTCSIIKRFPYAVRLSGILSQNLSGPAKVGPSFCLPRFGKDMISASQVVTVDLYHAGLLSSHIRALLRLVITCRSTRAHLTGVVLQSSPSWKLEADVGEFALCPRVAESMFRTGGSRVRPLL